MNYMYFAVVISGESYYFVFEKWFAVEKGDGKVEREVMAADRGLGFTKVDTTASCCELKYLRRALKQVCNNISIHVIITVR